MKNLRHLTVLLPLMVVLISLVGVSAALAWHNRPAGFITSRPAQIRSLHETVSVQPLLTTGDTLPNGYTMAAIPDGLGAFDNHDGTFTLMMNHELSDTFSLSDSRVSRLTIHKQSLRVLDASYLIDGTEGYHSFCSASMVGPDEGFEDYLFLTGEEATNSPYGGTAVAINPKTGEHTNLPWLGHMVHENTVALPGFGKIVTLSTEDTAPGYLYMYISDDQDDFLSGKGQLYVFAASTGITPDAISKSQQTSGTFVPIEQSENTDAIQLKAAATAKGAMTFARLEDLAYDHTTQGLFYFATTGRSQYINPATNAPYDAKGRLHAMQLDHTDPTRVTSLEILLSGDEGDTILNPDNIDTSENSVMLQEDINDEFDGVRPGRILHYHLKKRTVTPVAEVLQLDYNGQPIPDDKPGAWESSGILNVSRILGPGKWLAVTQAHTLMVDQFGSVDEGGQLLLLTVPGSGRQ